MLYPLSYERSPCSILHSMPSRCVPKTPRQLVGSSGCMPRRMAVNAGSTQYKAGGRLGLRPGLFCLDPADQILAADGFQQGWMIGGYVPPDHPDQLVIAVAAGHEPAFASDQLHPRASCSARSPQRNARMLA